MRCFHSPPPKHLQVLERVWRDTWLHVVCHFKDNQPNHPSCLPVALSGVLGWWGNFVGQLLLNNVACAHSHWELVTHFYLNILYWSWALCQTWLLVARNISPSCPATLLKKFPSVSSAMHYRHCSVLLRPHLQSSCLMQQDCGLFMQVIRNPGNLSSSFTVDKNDAPGLDLKAALPSKAKR